MKKSTKIILGALAIAGLLACWLVLTLGRCIFASDAVQVIAYGASDLYAKTPAATQDQIDDLIKRLHEASVINLVIDSTGKAVDPFGTSFRVNNEITDNTSITTVTSAGPDGWFDTWDDIQFVEEEHFEPRGANQNTVDTHAP